MGVMVLICPGIWGGNDCKFYLLNALNNVRYHKYNRQTLFLLCIFVSLLIITGPRMGNRLHAIALPEFGLATVVHTP